MPSDMQILHGTWEYSDSTVSSEFPAAKRRAMFSATTCACWTARRAAFWFCVSATSPIANTVGYAASASCRVGRTEMKPSDVRHPGASVRSGADIGVWPVARISGRGECRNKRSNEGTYHKIRAQAAPAQEIDIKFGAVNWETVFRDLDTLIEHHFDAELFCAFRNKLVELRVEFVHDPRSRMHQCD